MFGERNMKKMKMVSQKLGVNTKIDFWTLQEKNKMRCQCECDLFKQGHKMEMGNSNI